MLKTMSKWMCALAGVVVLSGSALAGDDQAAKPAPPPAKADKPAVKKKAPPPDDAPAPAADGAAADVKAARGVSKREPVEPGDAFEAGTKVWAWSSITGAKGSMVKHVWKRDGATLWEKEFEVKSGRYRTWTRRTVTKPGAYTVEVTDEGGAVLGSTSFTVN